MLNILKSDLYRFRKYKLFYGMTAFICAFASLLIIMIRQDIRLGISVIGNLTTFKNLEDIVLIGTQYQKGLGVVIAVLISVFNGQEYQWKTWQHKWLTNKSRPGIYLSKLVLSSAESIGIFLLFEAVVLFSSGKIPEMLTKYFVVIVCSTFIYAALGAVICLISMLIKNSITSVLVCLGYVLFAETLVSLVKNTIRFPDILVKLVDWSIRHSIYGMSSMVYSTPFSADLILPTCINSMMIIILSTSLGVFVFRKYEL